MNLSRHSRLRETGRCCMPGLNETHVTFSGLPLYFPGRVQPKAAFPFARSEWREPSYSLTPTTHTKLMWYGPYKLDYSYCITGNSGISQPAEINITFLHITSNMVYLGWYLPDTEFSIPFVFVDSFSLKR